MYTKKEIISEIKKVNKMDFFSKIRLRNILTSGEDPGGFKLSAMSKNEDFKNIEELKAFQIEASKLIII